MPIIPMKQEVIITKPGTSNGWGETTAGTTSTFKVRVDEKSEVVTNQAGEEALSSLTIYFDKLIALSYNDTIKYTNELGVTVEREPISIQVIRGPGGKAMLTRVSL